MVQSSRSTTYKKVGEGKMAYRYFGNTGMRVSVLGYGNWQTADTADKEEEVYQVQKAAMKRCFESGVNFYDTAEVYGGGVAELSMGRAFRELKEEMSFKRKDYCLTTKIFWWNKGEGCAVNDKGLSRKHIVEGLRNSLKRLEHEYVDIVFAHRPDYDTPLEETVRAFSWCIDKGLANYWGTSEWPAIRFEEACQIADRLGLHAPQAEQPQYSMMVRQRFEAEYKPLFETRKIATTIWSPLLVGFLAGRYNDGNIPDGRVKDAMKSAGSKFHKYFTEEGMVETKRLLQGLADIAKDIGFTQAQLALAWTIANEDTSVALLGFSRIEQVDENLKAVELLEKWTKEIEERVTTHLNTTPDMEIDKTWKPALPRRPFNY